MFRRALIALLLLVPLIACAQSPAPPAIPANAEPRLGVDYEILETPQPTYGQGKIEVAEVFSYMCIHCAHFQPSVNAWKKKLPADVRYEYVPGVFGGAWDSFARAYFAAEIMGVQPRTHDAVFKAIHIDHVLKTGSLEEIADLYGTMGVDRNKFLATMNSFAVTAKLNRAKQFAVRTGVNATPTLIIAGKYRVLASQDRGLEYMFTTTNFLLARERAMAKPAAVAPAKPAVTKPAAKKA
ncbi:MAG TPA: thiol:disulfide interchange protein DsbA/DsbL [Arenimonas sp.]|uniref:thiol:disulfide interchange protein DsbA/DsbL n=1 Tax=Arenimonas sp. TaxID=1872635 RepID=UPI002BAEB540|nr:thiol:disulfide interchange protein DsbA/DsbL [Arenimonas sp.]HMB58041.1 thiol:disulfide interchange protein DsbA/DsbL [Arenimonas sp.]